MGSVRARLSAVVTIPNAVIRFGRNPLNRSRGVSLGSFVLLRLLASARILRCLGSFFGTSLVCLLSLAFRQVVGSFVV